MKQKLLDANLGNSLNYRIWIATYEDVGYNILLPTLYDWRNGAINTTDSIGVYVFDEDEVSFLGDEFTKGTELGTICLPSQRDSLGDLFEILDPPFNWTLQVATSEDINAMNLTRAANEPLCEVLIINKYLSIGNGLDQIHDDVQAAINRVGNTEVNFWFMNSTPGEDELPVTEAMFELNRLNGAPWDYSLMVTSAFSSLIQTTQENTILSGMFEKENHVPQKIEKISISSSMN